MDYYSSLNASTLDPDNPTLFELLSAHQLQDLISPSLRYIISFYAQRHPQYLLKIANRYDEIYAILMGVVEYYHLSTWNSSFTERFYGLKRTRLLNSPALLSRNSVPDKFESLRRLTRKQIIGSLIFAVALPYVKEKLDARYETLKGRYMFRSIESDEPAPDAPRSAKLKYQFDKLLLKAYPLFTMARASVGLLFFLGYLFSKTPYSSIEDLILGIKFSRLNAYDYNRNEPPKLDEDDQSSYIQKFVRRVQQGQGLQELQNIALSSLSYALPTSMFLLKFLEWWYSSDFAQQMSKKPRNTDGEDDNLSVPTREYPSTQDVLPNVAKYGLCPLCKEPISNPTVIESGVAFCYPCIYRHLENGDKETGGRCPVTGQKLLLCRYDDENGWQVGGLRRLMI